jgi:hypothetical protein
MRDQAARGFSERAGNDENGQSLADHASDFIRAGLLLCVTMLNDFTPSERRALRGLTTPFKLQRFLDDIPYNLEPGGSTCYSPRLVLRNRLAHCMEGALLGAVGLRLMGYPPLVIDMEAVRDTDHVVAIYRANGGWGAVGKSNYAGLRSREPAYRTLRELVMSYFENYFNPAKEKTLRTYSLPVNLARFDHRGWMTAERDVWEIPEYLCGIRHFPLFTPAMERSLSRMDRRLWEANCVGTAK